MASGDYPLPYTQESYEFWREERQVTAPYFEAIYGQVRPLFDGSETILDLAGGEGHTQEVLGAELAPRLTTVDWDRDALRRLRAQHPGAKTVHADVNKLPFDDESFDAAISLNGLGGMPHCEQAAGEVARILKPGGFFVFMHDIPRSLRDIALDALDARPEDERDHIYYLPVLNGDSGNVDVFAYMMQVAVDHLPDTGDISATLIFNETKHLLGEDWIQNVYGDPLKVATHAKLFRRLVTAVRAVHSPEAARTTAPLVPTVETLRLERFDAEDTLETEKISLEANFGTDEPETIDGQAVSTMYVDELARPRITYKKKSSPDGGTKIKGKTPLFIARKAA